MSSWCPEARPGPQCSPLSYWGWPGPTVGAGKWYSGPSPMPSLGFVPIGIYQCQPSPQACPELPPSPMGCGRGFGCCTYQPTFSREPLPPCTELPLSSMGPHSPMQSRPRLITRAGSSAHFPAFQHVQSTAALSCPFAYGPQWSWSLFIAGNGET